ncbi:uncharacterized protein LOC126370140 [Pectinophora gossypiella]|uniref:uncharacterized protein LOC126370140 n=1 Tax=Pectinophora gossypiella TaxID=13191 RepID=UPI00214F098C|nr:uncharacterized protein LOC126370140 [Pectinophora gossypiella]
MVIIKEHGLTDDELTYEVTENVDPSEEVAVFIESRRGKTILQYNDHRYRKAYKSKHGVRWVCSIDKNCPAFVYLNDNDEIIMSNQEHTHTAPMQPAIEAPNDTAVVITSRKGKEMLLFKHYTYRKQYNKGSRSRWVCSTLKNCRACVFTNNSNVITSAFEEHCHDPPKYYLKPNHVLEALREPLIFESD